MALSLILSGKIYRIPSLLMSIKKFIKEGNVQGKKNERDWMIPYETVTPTETNGKNLYRHKNNNFP